MMQPTSNEPPEFDITDFIGVFPNAVDPNFCSYLCEYVDKAEQVMPRNYTHVKDKQICFLTKNKRFLIWLRDGVQIRVQI